MLTYTLAFLRAIQESLVEYQRGFTPKSGQCDDISPELSPCVNEDHSEMANVPNGRVSSGVSETIPEAEAVTPGADNLELALRLSEQERLEEEKRIKEEEELFQQVLRLSMTDKWLLFTHLISNFLLIYLLFIDIIGKYF